MSSDDDNVLNFPTVFNSPIQKLPETKKEMDLALLRVREDYVVEIATMVTERMFEGLQSSFREVGNGDPETTKHHLMVLDSVISLLNYYYGIPHIMQEVAEKIYVDNGSEEMVWAKGIVIEKFDSLGKDNDDIDPIEDVGS